ncbi:MAG: preprotein translocase subunit YajC [Planctomycetota bacterium]
MPQLHPLLAHHHHTTPAVTPVLNPTLAQGENVVDPTQVQTPADQTGTQQPADPNAPAGNTPPPQSNPGFFGGNFLFIMLIVLVVMMVFTFSGGRKEKKRKAEMLNNLSKGNRVQTVGGIIGSVVEVRDNEIIVKVDENANTRLHFTKAAIATVLEDNKDV